jgi:ribose 1,5-bisphosphate isomerase
VSQRSADLAELPPLPEAAAPLVEKLLHGPLLGASRTIRVINDLLCEIADNWSSSGPALLDTLIQSAGFFVATRGMNTPAIGNALGPVMRDLEARRTENPDVAAIRDWIHGSKDAYNAQSLRNLEAMAEYGADTLADADTVIAFDYSSTMIAILERIAVRGRRIRVIAPESRCLDGGRPIVEQATASGHKALFIPDMAVGHFIREADAVLVGAEAIFANGDCWNTIGSYPLAELARIHRVPFYVATELIKIDPRSFTGDAPPVRPRDFGAVLGSPGGFSHPDRISTVAPELDTTPGSLISAYITPVGVLPPDRIRGEAGKLFA